MSDITITAKVDMAKITNAIVGAFEGGSNYWIDSADYAHVPEGTFERPYYSDDNFWNAGGRMILQFEETDTFEIGLPEFEKGLASMAAKSPSHFGDLVSENDDACTHDVFIQHVLFGEVIYG